MNNLIMDDVLKIRVPNKSINIYNNDKSECKKFEVVYLKCMKHNDPSHTKCKREFEEWYDCFKLLKY
jgi:hypothetical protein